MKTILEITAFIAFVIGTLTGLFDNEYAHAAFLITTAIWCKILSADVQITKTPSDYLRNLT